ncbi:MAG: hypothetical protein AAGE52_38105 [Myxococcota bacterium]
MGSVGQLLAYAFYVIMAGAVAYFAHKILWFLRYRRIQEKLVTRALEKLTEQADTTVVRWDRGAEVSWSEAAASRDDGTPRDYVRRVEAQLADLDRELSSSHVTLRDRFVEHVMNELDPEEIPVLRVPLRNESSQEVALTLAFAQVPDPELPSAEIFELEVRSRYSFRRRLLAFFLGAADVVYSSQHVIRMSQNPHAPKGLLFRRLSLVVLILAALAVDIGFGIRQHLIESAEQWCSTHLELEGALAEYLPSAIGLGIWLGAYGALYVGLYLLLRWRSERQIDLLEELRESYVDRVSDIRDEHLASLERWARDYATTLDDASSLTMHQAQMLVQRTTHRLRRRIASPRLLELAGEVARCFFVRLPESATKLQDVATEKKHSFAHSIWPRESEMSYQVEIAKYRHAWRDVEMCLSTLRGQHPDPELAGQLWRSLVRYARMFPEVVPEDLFERLQEAHGNTVARIVEETDADLSDLDERLRELADALRHTVDSVKPLVDSRIELTTQAMNAAVAEFTAEALRIRERARLEAMAFEI